MLKKLFVTAAVAFATLAASAALPSVNLKDVDGKSIDTAELAALNDGKPVVISFWATWCKPCVRELNAIKEVYDEWQEETGVKVIAVSIDEAQNAQKVKPLVSRMGWDYDVILDPNSDFKRQMGVSDPPHVFVVDGQGNVVWNHQGYVDGGEEEIFEAVKKALGE